MIYAALLTYLAAVLIQAWIAWQLGYHAGTDAMQERLKAL